MQFCALPKTCKDTGNCIHNAGIVHERRSGSLMSAIWPLYVIRIFAAPLFWSFEVIWMLSSRFCSEQRAIRGKWPLRGSIKWSRVMQLKEEGYLFNYLSLAELGYLRESTLESWAKHLNIWPCRIIHPAQRISNFITSYINPITFTCSVLTSWT